MTHTLSPEAIARLETQQNIWFTSVRADGRPHMAPVWFVWFEDKIYISTDPKSVKRRNIEQNPHVVLALEEGTHPLISEGAARAVPAPYPQPLLDAFFKKYEWDINSDAQYNFVIEINPEKWLSW